MILGETGIFMQILQFDLVVTLTLTFFDLTCFIFSKPWVLLIQCIRSSFDNFAPDYIVVLFVFLGMAVKISRHLGRHLELRH